MGSRLHRSDTGSFIAYAQWPDQAAYEAASEWPPELAKYRDRMRALLKTGRPRVLHKLHIEVDSFKDQVYKGP